MRPPTGLGTIAGAVMLALVAARSASADCLEDLQRAAAAQIADLDAQDQTPARSTTTRIDLRTGKVMVSVVTEHAPPDRSRVVRRVDKDVEVTLTTGDRLWVGHGGTLQEVPDSIARERIDEAHQHLVAFRAQLVAADWKQRAQGLTCQADAKLDGRPAVLFSFTDAESGLPTRLYADPTSMKPWRTEASGNGISLVQSIDRDPDVHIDLPATPK